MSTAALPEPFPSLLAMRETHLDMLEQRETLRDSPDYPNRIGALINKFVATGALMESPSDRRIGQSIIDYWTTELQRNGNPDASAVLAGFNVQWRERNQQECPYKGLESFQIADHDKFYGRDSLIRTICSALQEKRLVTMLGESGSGKSSLLRAGVLFTLGKSGAFTIKGTILPGSKPMDALAGLFAPAGSGPIPADPDSIQKLLPDPRQQKILIAVDQFEELFTLTSDEQQQQAFVRALLRIWQSGHAVALTVREDLWDKEAESLGESAQAFKDAEVRIPAMSASELRSAIEIPAKQAGLSFEAGLIDQLIADMENEPSALPLLQFTLLQLWKRRQRNPWESEGQGRITWDAYRRLRGPKWALAETADRVYSDMSPEAQQICRVVMLRLVRPMDNYEVLSSRERLRDVKTVANAATVQRVVDALTEARLLRLTKGQTEDDTQIEVAHEALIRNWPRLIGWLNDARLDLRKRFRLREVTRSWVETKDSGLLWSGLALEEAKQYQDLSSNEQKFVQASTQAAEAIAAEKKELERRREERVKVLTFYVVTLVLLVIGLGIVAVVAYKSQKKAEQALAEAKQNLALAKSNEALANYNFTLKNEASAAVENLVRTDVIKQSPTITQTQNPNKASAIYIILQNEDQRPQAEQISVKLTAAGYKVGKPRVVTFGPDSTELRYFQTDQKNDADNVDTILNALGILGIVKEQSVSWGKGDANWFELWFGKPPAK